MKKPEIEVVRFGAEDVIATSGLSNRAYVTSGKEVLQSGLKEFRDYNTYNLIVVRDYNYYYFEYDNGIVNRSWAKYDTSTDSSTLGKGLPYAWYNNTSNGSWGTDQKDYRLYNNIYPEGIDD